MKSDELFFEFFKLAPEAIFELFQLTPHCTYNFNAPVIKKEIKKVERRLDGLLEPSDRKKPHHFVEFQGYDDTTIYWRILHQISLLHELEPKRGKLKWQALVIFLDSSYDPGVESLGSLANSTKDWLHKGTLADLLDNIPNPSPVLDVLRPIAADVHEVMSEAPIWAKNLKQLPQPYIGAQARLEQIFIQFVMQKLTHLSRKEIDKMLGLTPLEQTIAGKELIELGRLKGRQEGRQEGRQDGLQEGKRQAVLQLLVARFGSVSPSVKGQIEAISDITLLDQLFSDALTFTSYDEFEQSLADSPRLRGA